MLTVTTEATDFALIDLAVAKAALDQADTSEDEALQGFIDRASDVISRHCRRVFARETVSEQFRLDQVQEELILARYPVVTVASIVENGITLAASDYEVNLATGIVTRLSSDEPTWWPACKITVTYSAGFELPANTPDALQQACLQLVKAYFLGADRDPLIRSESVTPMTSASYFGGADYLPPDVAGLLGQFRNIRMR